MLPLSTDPAHATILVVDDDEAVTQTFARMLRLEGYEVCTAVNPEVGLRVAGEAQPHAIILDLRMPLMDGLGFLRRLRALDGHQNTPVAIVTGSSTIRSRTKCASCARSYATSRSGSKTWSSSRTTCSR
jgi:two-component system response regulator PrrA